MSGRHKFRNLLEQLPPERRAAIEERAAELLAAMPSPQTHEENNQALVPSGPDGHTSKQEPGITRESTEKWEPEQAKAGKPTEEYR